MTEDHARERQQQVRMNLDTALINRSLPSKCSLESYFRRQCQPVGSENCGQTVQ